MSPHPILQPKQGYAAYEGRNKWHRTPGTNFSSLENHWLNDCKCNSTCAWTMPKGQMLVYVSRVPQAWLGLVLLHAQSGLGSLSAFCWIMMQATRAVCCHAKLMCVIVLMGSWWNNYLFQKQLHVFVCCPVLKSSIREDLYYSTECNVLNITPYVTCDEPIPWTVFTKWPSCFF